jgi:hypothetical protein
MVPTASSTIAPGSFNKRSIVASCTGLTLLGSRGQLKGLLVEIRPGGAAFRCHRACGHAHVRRRTITGAPARRSVFRGVCLAPTKGMATRSVRPPEVIPLPGMERPLRWRPDERWQLMCGDENSWRAGVLSPVETSLFEIDELVQHDCPVLFLLLEGHLTVVFANNAGELHELPLEPGAPVLISAPHAAYCPDGPHRGVALIVQRADLSTQLQPAPRLEW